MASGGLDLGALNCAFSSAQISKDTEPTGPTYSNNEDDAGGVKITCFSEVVVDTALLHFQIIRLPKQNSAVGVTSILGGASENTGSGIARRLVLKTGLNTILACNIPKNSLTREADGEKLLVQKLISLGYTRLKSEGLSS